MPLTSFVSLDFETMTAERTSACAVGMAKVINGVITSKFYTLINPIPDDREHINAHVNGITRDMVVDAPTFEEAFDHIKNFIGDFVIVCHNAAFDINVLENCMNHYHLTGINTSRVLCTYEATGLSLDKACSKYEIKLGKHHDAMDDAIACAKIFLAWCGCDIKEPNLKSNYTPVLLAGERKYEHSTLIKLDDECIENKSTPFYGAKVVITGVFGTFDNRNRIGKALQSLGADIDTSISKKTTIVIVGADAGPSKMAKVKKLIDEGHNIKIMEELELKQYIDDIY